MLGFVGGLVYNLRLRRPRELGDRAFPTLHMTIKAQAPETPQLFMCPEVIYEIRPRNNLRIHYYVFLSVVLVLVKVKEQVHGRDFKLLAQKKKTGKTK